MKNNILPINKICYCIDCKKQLSFTAYWRKIKRCISCSKKLQYKNNPHSSFKGGLPHCIVCNKELSVRGLEFCGRHSHLGKKRPEQSQLMKGKNNPQFGKLTLHGKRIKYKNILMRSTWEVAYAKWLDKQGTKWLYEPKTFDLGNTTYTPDFYLPETDTYVEIKGWWRDDAKKKFRLFKKLYFNKKINLLLGRDLKSLEVL